MSDKICIFAKSFHRLYHCMTDHIHSRRFHTSRALPRWGWVLVLLALMLGNEARAEECAVTYGAPVQGSLCESSSEVPQWQDVGLEDLLVVNSQPSVPTASNVQCTVYNVQWGGNGNYASFAMHYSRRMVLSRSVPGCFIYFLLSLRL